MARKAVAFALLTCPPLAVAALSFFVCGTSAPVALTLGFLSSFLFCDAWYFLRMAHNATALWLTEQGFSKQQEPCRPLFAVSEVKGRIYLNDIDRNGHCNNARFLRECGFGRRDLWQHDVLTPCLSSSMSVGLAVHNQQHNGVWKVITASGGNLVVGSQTVRYRRELSFGEPYTLETRVLCWDDRAFYVEHRFVTTQSAQSGGGKFINAIIIVKNTVLGKLRPQKIVEKLPDLSEEEHKSPEISKDIVAWIESNDVSSKLLRAESSKK